MILTFLINVEIEIIFLKNNHFMFINCIFRSFYNRTSVYVFAGPVVKAITQNRQPRYHACMSEMLRDVPAI